MSALEESTQLASEGGRRIFVGQDPINLRTKDGSNCVYVLELPTSRSGAAGRRVGGIGERKIQKLHCFRLEDGNWMEIYETKDEEKLERFELPYQAAGLGVTMPDGTEKVVTGVIDAELIQRYEATI